MHDHAQVVQVRATAHQRLQQFWVRGDACAPANEFDVLRSNTSVCQPAFRNRVAANRPANEAPMMMARPRVAFTSMTSRSLPQFVRTFE
jgi:hypothetical protein